MRWGGVLAVGAAVALAQQTDEVRVSAHVYSPTQLHLTAQASLVPLEVVVRDGRGHALSGLTQSDFEVLDEGKPREITAFSVSMRDVLEAAAAAPAHVSTTAVEIVPETAAKAGTPRRSTMLFFDDLHGAAADLQRTQAAAKRFIREGLGPGARAAVFSAHEGLTLDFTPDSDALTAAIEKLRAHQKFSENGLMPCPRITPYQAFLIDNNLSVDALNAAMQEERACVNATPSKAAPRRTSMSLSTSPATASVRAQAAATWQQAREQSLNEFDALQNALAVLERATGTRVLLMVSTGFLSGLMDAEKDAAISRAIHAGIVIDALDAKGLWSEAPGRPFDQPSQTVGGLPHDTFVFETMNIGAEKDAMNEAMQEFAAGTGGLFFHNNNDLVGGFAQLAAVPEATYLLAIRPDPEGAAGKYHKLKVRLTSKSSDYVQTRPGYFAPPKAPVAEANGAGRPIDQHLLSSDMLTGFPIALTARTDKTDKGDGFVSTLIHVDLATLKFSRLDDRHVQKLVFIEALLDSSGKMVTAKEGEMDLALKDDSLARLTGSGVNAGLKLAAPPGVYKLRVVVQDAEGKMASLDQDVEILK
jgi:VWFA-related protein